MALSNRNFKTVTGCLAETRPEIELLAAGGHPLANVLHDLHPYLDGTAALAAQSLDGRHLRQRAQLCFGDPIKGVAYARGRLEVAVQPRTAQQANKVGTHVRKPELELQPLHGRHKLDERAKCVGPEVAAFRHVQHNVHAALAGNLGISLEVREPLAGQISLDGNDLSVPYP